MKVWALALAALIALSGAMVTIALTRSNRPDELRTVTTPGIPVETAAPHDEHAAVPLADQSDGTAATNASRGTIPANTSTRSTRTLVAEGEFSESSTDDEREEEEAELKREAEEAEQRQEEAEDRAKAREEQREDREDARNDDD